MAATLNIIELEMRDQKIKEVTVLNDRAEVKRLVKVSIKKGTNEVLLKNCAQALVSDSLRVEGRGKAVIHDVVKKYTPALKQEADSPKVAALRANLKEAEKSTKRLEDQRDIIQKRIDSLDRIISEVGSGVVNPPKNSGAQFLVDGKTLDSLQNLFTFYDDNAEKLKISLRDKEEEIEASKEIVNKARRELNQAVNQFSIDRHSQNVHITLEATEDGEAELDVTYQVFNASWKPHYDVRVDTKKPSMVITYYGTVQQTTGEDWNDCHAVLSTAQPCLGGNIPELGTLDAMFYRPAPPAIYMARRSTNKAMGMVRSLASARAPEVADTVEMEVEPMEVSQAAEITQNVLSREFKIARETTIPNGAHDHKVTIGIVTLVPALVHESVPSKNAAAFLTASAINTSELEFLAGNASVFLNNAFVAQTWLKNVSSGERFSCSLGVDTAIRVEYKPAKKGRGESGYINKHATDITEQTISIKNTRTEQPVLITIKHHVPRSTDDNIKIKLIHPSATPFDPAAAETPDLEADRKKKVGAKFNADNNLEWTVEVEPGKSKDLVLKWTVEHPKDEKIVFKEAFGQSSH